MKPRIIYIDNFLTGQGRTPTTGTTLVKLFRQEGYEVIATSKKQNKALRLADMLYTICTNCNNTVVVIATYSGLAFYFAFCSAVLCRLTKTPYILCLHGGNLPNRIKKSSWISGFLFSNSYMNVVVSGYLQQTMKEKGWKYSLIPNNIDINTYRFKQRNTCSPSLFWVRSFHQIYNPTLAIKAVAGLVEKYPDIRLTMVGPDKDGSLAACKELVEKLRLEKNITFTGLLSRDQWTSLAHSHDIFINTTNFDNLPVSVVEAMALGLVVISTKVGGVPYLIEDLQDGVLVPPGNEKALIDAIEMMINNKELAPKLSAAARKKAEVYDWDNIKVLWSELFNNVPAYD